MKRKKFMLVSLGLCSSLFMFAQNGDGLVLLGDMDNDGKITKYDVEELTNVVMGKRHSRYIPAKCVRVNVSENVIPPVPLTEKRHLMGDVNQDGKVSVADVVLAMDMVLGNKAKKYIYPDMIFDTLGVKNGHEYVDLGLSVKWATNNVGANSSFETGEYYAWGEVRAKKTYNWSTYEWMTKGTSNWRYINKYTIDDYMTSASWYDDGQKFIGDGKNTIGVCDDVVSENWGAEWRTPTFYELEELQNKCTWRWTSNYNSTGKSGYVITSKVVGYTGNSIFLPTTGYMDGSSLRISGTNGGYWTCELSDYYSFCAYALGFNSESIYWFEMDRCNGFCVRPVYP